MKKRRKNKLYIEGIRKGGKNKNVKEIIHTKRAKSKRMTNKCEEKKALLLSDINLDCSHDCTWA